MNRSQLDKMAELARDDVRAELTRTGFRIYDDVQL
jgi:hypothetical protein